MPLIARSVGATTELKYAPSEMIGSPVYHSWSTALSRKETISSVAAAGSSALKMAEEYPIRDRLFHLSHPPGGRIVRPVDLFEPGEARPEQREFLRSRSLG